MSNVVLFCGITNILTMLLIIINKYFYDKKLKKMMEDFEEFCGFRVHCSENSVRASFEKIKDKEWKRLRDETVMDVNHELYYTVRKMTKSCFKELNEKEVSNRIEVIFKTEED